MKPSADSACPADSADFLSPFNPDRILEEPADYVRPLINRSHRSTSISLNRPVPYGTVAFLHGYQAINCLVIII